MRRSVMLTVWSGGGAPPSTGAPSTALDFGSRGSVVTVTVAADDTVELRAMAAAELDRLLPREPRDQLTLAAAIESDTGAWGEDCE